MGCAVLSTFDFPFLNPLKSGWLSVKRQIGPLLGTRQVRSREFQKWRRDMNFFPWGNFDRKVWAQKIFDLIVSQFVQFWHFALTHPITPKLYQDIEDIIPKKNHEKKANIFGHFSKKVIWNLNNCQNFKTFSEQN